MSTATETTKPARHEAAQAGFAFLEKMEFAAAPPSGALAALKETLSEIAPGVWVTGLPEFEVPSHVLCRLMPGKEPGTYILQPEPYPGWVRLTDDFGKRLGIHGLSASTLRRLLWAGYIEHARVGADTIMVSIESLLSHFHRTANDCAQEKSFWDAKRREHWRSVCESISNQ
jgi:hypothetical protein